LCQLFLIFIQLNAEDIAPSFCLDWKIWRISFCGPCENPLGYDKVPALMALNRKNSCHVLQKRHASEKRRQNC
jgi:hypothetical protein